MVPSFTNRISLLFRNKGKENTNHHIPTVTNEICDAAVLSGNPIDSQPKIIPRLTASNRPPPKYPIAYPRALTLSLCPGDAISFSAAS